MNDPVNIVYPIDGAAYPASAYVTLSFSTTCQGGIDLVEWGVDGNTHGKAAFYDQFSGQYAMKLPNGHPIFWVRSRCGQNQIQFNLS